MIKGDIWCIAYINRNFINLVSEELNEYGYEDVEAYIPTVKVLKKKFKQKQEFEEVPLLFNYGFFRVSYDNACNEEYLSMLRQRITAIYGWVKDPSIIMEQKPPLKDPKGEDEDDFTLHYMEKVPRAAVATDQEVAEMVKSARKMNIFSEEDIDSLKKGDYIVLKGYPFDDLPAEVISVSKKRKEVRVKLLLDTAMSEVKVSFENIFYTIYSSFDSNMKETIESELNLSSDADLERVLFNGGNYE